jgi:hypothetical protein
VKVTVTAFAASTTDEAEFARQQISFYASTPSYRSILALHGWEEIAQQLSMLASRGRWAEMPALIDDEMLGTFCVIAPEGELPAALRARYQHLADRLGLYLPFVPGERDDFWRTLVSEFAQ